MNVTATYNGEAVTIVDRDVNGGTVYVTYVDSSNVMQITTELFPNLTSSVELALSATVN